MLIILLLTSGCVHASDAVPLKTLSIDFRREVIENDKTEVAIGTVHYDAADARVVIKVKAPIKQIMVVKDNVLEIYYPLKNRAFRFTAKAKIPFPFVESLLQSIEAEYGLTAIGYSLDRHQIANDVLYTYWTPPAKAKDKLEVVIIGSHAGRLVSVEVRTPDDRLATKSLFCNHTKLGDRHFPMEVSHRLYGQNTELIEQQRIIYSNPQLNGQPFQFEIPKSVKVKEFKG